MQHGKISEITYKRSVLKKITDKTEGIRPGVDAAKIKLEGITLVMSSNCIVKWFCGCEEYYIQKSVNGICEQGGCPLGIQLELNIPSDYEEKLLGKIIKKFNDAAKLRNLNIVQCRVYGCKTAEPTAHVTVIGSAKGSVSCTKMKPGMDVVMTKSIAIGGTAVISEMYKDKLQKKFSASFVLDCLKLKEYISVEKESQIAIENGAVAMHSISDGGAFSAIWELASSINMGITVNIPDIPVWQETVEVAEMFDINPYLLDGTGALLVVTEKGEEMAEQFKNCGIYASVIGKITDGKDRIAVNGDEVRYLEPPRGDEIYKLLSCCKRQ